MLVSIAVNRKSSDFAISTSAADTEFLNQRTELVICKVHTVARARDQGPRLIFTVLLMHLTQPVNPASSSADSESTTGNDMALQAYGTGHTLVTTCRT